MQARYRTHHFRRHAHDRFTLGIILAEPIGMAVWLGLGLVCFGIFLVNR